jgi:iron complex transport system substrate-binding protein
VLFGGVRSGVAAACAAALISVAVCAGCTSSDNDDRPGAASVITSTTQIAGSGVLGNERRPDESCAPEPAEPDSGSATQRAHNAAGMHPESVEVPTDAQRIVVLAGDQLDALCALGLQSRIVAAALPDGSDQQPSYLGTVVHDLPGAGDRSAPDVAGIAAAHPDLILGSQALTPRLYPELAEIAPTVFTGAPGSTWEDTLRAVGAATARADATDEVLESFNDEASRVGADHDASHFQASVVQLTEDTVRVYGAATFPGSVLAAAGVGRPASQRFTDKPFVELGAADSGSAELSPADADIVYVSFASPTAKERAVAVLDSQAWRHLSAHEDGRVFVVNNEVWQAGQGVVAARGILDDLGFIDAPINSAGGPTPR